MFERRPSAAAPPWVRCVPVVLFVVAAALRMPGLERLPPGLAADEAFIGLDAVSLSAGTESPLFLPANHGREPMHFWLVSLGVRLLGRRPLAVRLGPALAGAATAAAAALLALRLWGPVHGLCAGVLLAVGTWPLNVSRIGLRAGFAPLLEVGAILCVVRASRTRRVRDLILAGSVTGLGHYTYFAYHLFPLVVLVWALLVCTRGVESRRWLHPVWIIVGWAVMAAPLAFYAAYHPLYVTSRLDVASLAGRPDAGVAAMLPNAVRYVGQFLWHGGPATFVNTPGKPLLCATCAGLFVAGIVLSAARTRRVAAGLGVWFVVMLLPGVLSSHADAPNALRSVGVLPLPYLLAGLSVAELWGLRRRWPMLLAGALLALTVWWELTGYFGEWARFVRRDREIAYSIRETELARCLSSDVAGESFLSPQLFFHPAIAFLCPPETGRYDLLWRSDVLCGPEGPVRLIVNLADRDQWFLWDEPRRRLLRWWQLNDIVPDARVWESLIRARWSDSLRARGNDRSLARSLTEELSLSPGETWCGFTSFEIEARKETIQPKTPAGTVDVELRSTADGNTAAVSSEWLLVPSAAMSVSMQDAPQPGELEVLLREYDIGPAVTVTRVPVERGDVGEAAINVTYPSRIRISYTPYGASRPEEGRAGHVRLTYLGPPPYPWLPRPLHSCIQRLRRLKAWLVGAVRRRLRSDQAQAAHPTVDAQRDPTARSTARKTARHLH